MPYPDNRPELEVSRTIATGTAPNALEPTVLSIVLYHLCILSMLRLPQEGQIK